MPDTDAEMRQGDASASNSLCEQDIPFDHPVPDVAENATLRRCILDSGVGEEPECPAVGISQFHHLAIVV